MWFDADEFQRLRQLGGVTWGRPVRVLAQVTSTNDLALEAVRSDARTGIVWVAAEQTKGRGRRGTQWLANPGEALLTSVLLRWPGPRTPTLGLSLAAGLAVREVCSQRLPDKRCLLKWPNDVLAGGHKLAGVLIETRTGERGALGVVVGVGLNVQARSFPPEAGAATSLRLLGADAGALDYPSLLADLLAALESRVPRVMKGELLSLIEEARAHDALLDRRVLIEDAALASQEAALPSGSQTGMARGLSEHGHLLLETAAGTVEVRSGHVVVTSEFPVGA